MGMIVKRELRSYFTGAFGYITVSALLLLMGVFAYLYNFKDGYTDFEYVLDSMSFVYLILAPLLTMRSFAEEHRHKIDQLTLTAPLKPADIVLGKFIAVMGLLLVPMFVACIYPFIYSFYGAVNFSMAYSSILAFYLLGGVTFGLGLLVSSLSTNPAIAGLITFALLFICYIMSGILQIISDSMIAVWIVLVVLSVLAGIIAFGIIHNKKAAYYTSFITAAIAVILYLLFGSTLLDYLLQLLRSMQIFAQFSVFVYGLFDMTLLANYICACAILLLLCTLSVESLRR